MRRCGTTLASLAASGRLLREARGGGGHARAGAAASRLPSAARRAPGPAGFRVLVVSNEAVPALLSTGRAPGVDHAPRVLVCVLDATSGDLGALLYGPDAVVKLVLTAHKTAATGLLLALAGS